MQKQELLAYQKQLHRVRSLIDSHSDDLTISEVSKLNELITGVSSELNMIALDESKSDFDKYRKYVNDTIDQQIKVNGIMLKCSIKYAGFAERPESPASVSNLYETIKKGGKPTIEDLLVFFQITLFENVYIFSTAELNVQLKGQHSTSDLTKRKLLEKAHKDNGGRLTTDQLKKLAQKTNKSFKALQNMYNEIWMDIK